MVFTSRFTFRIRTSAAIISVRRQRFSDSAIQRNYAPQNLLLYFDAKSQWPAVYKQNKTCREKQAVLIDDFNQVINLTEYRREYRATTASGCRLDPTPDPATNQSWYRCVHHRTFQSYRERWWFIAVDNCDTTQGLRLHYRLSMTNSQTNRWLRHFSADQFYILHTDAFMCLLFYLLLIATCFEAYALYTRHLFHKTYKLYIVSLLAGKFFCFFRRACTGLLFLVIYYAVYAEYGYANIWLRLIGKGFEAASTLAFLLLLLLLSKGYSITRARLKPRTVTNTPSTPGEVLYIYESFFGYALVGMRLLAWSWFSYAIVFTLIHYPQKSAFFAKLFLVYSIWFISAPIVIMVASFVIPKYMREKIINAVELAIAFKAHLFFFFLTRPSRANKNFPFHVRTTQIAIMDKAGNVDTGTLDHFTNYKYAPTRSTPLSVFVLSNTGGGGGANQTPTLTMANGNGGNHGQRQVISGGGGLAFNGKGGIGAAGRCTRWPTAAAMDITSLPPTLR
ncbi:hypothetical protein TYRP_020644 [Tyrophagus putrescentiae]|nr:hypothetical protein TYRP_020644 [Tyrophagus putrescentiae]